MIMDALIHILAGAVGGVLVLAARGAWRRIRAAYARWNLRDQPKDQMFTNILREHYSSYALSKMAKAPLPKSGIAIDTESPQ